MSYKIFFSRKTMESLWRLSKYCGEPSIIQQVRNAMNDYLRRKEMEIGTSIEDVTEAMAKHSMKERERNESKY